MFKSFLVASAVIFALILPASSFAGQFGVNYQCTVNIYNNTAVITNRNGNNPQGTTATFNWHTQNDKFKGVYFKTRNPANSTFGAVHAIGCESRGPQAPGNTPNMVSCYVMTYMNWTNNYNDPGIPVFGYPYFTGPLGATFYEGFPTVGIQQVSGTLADGFGFHGGIVCTLKP